MSVLLDLALAGSRIATGVGVALIVAAVAVLVLLALTPRRTGRTRVAEQPRAQGRAQVPQGYWHPSMGSRPEPVTQLLPRCADDLDATVLIPRQRTAVGGGRRG
ncbi:hypothetical protein ACGFIY_21070 [Micromonospora chersina]|uniref:hypothetical protein n=1 Tax=Micromonospora chersina TaxID=47854 RepID=UPI0037207A78